MILKARPKRAFERARLKHHADRVILRIHQQPGHKFSHRMLVRRREARAAKNLRAGIHPFRAFAMVMLDEINRDQGWKGLRRTRAKKNHRRSAQ